jgi:hypothetical protein
MAEAPEIPDFSEWRVKTPEHAVKIIRAQIERVQGRHVRTFVPIPSQEEVAKREQRKQFTLLMLEYGIAIGLIEFAHQAGLLEDVGYKALRAEATALTVPGVVGIIGG